MSQVSRKAPFSRAMLLCLALAVRAIADHCAQPFSIPITNVSLTDGTFARGLAVTVGTPGQTLSMQASVETNNTYIYDTKCQCSGNTQDWCSTYRGGLFEPTSSSTYDTSLSLNASGADPFDTWVNAAALQENIWSTDTFRLTSNVSCTVPFGIMRADAAGQYQVQHALGLGPNSTILNALRSNGTIASRSWSMYWGNSGITEASPGTFVFGGFDQGRISGSNTTAPLAYSEKCTTGMEVTIDNLELTYPNGTTASLFQGSTSSAALLACIVPDFPVMMTLPRFTNSESDDMSYYGYLEAIAGLEETDTHSNGINFFANTYPSSESIDFGLAISFASGLNVQIANSQLVQPDETIISNGSITNNATVNDLNIIALQSTNTNDFVILGRQLLSGTYLLVNYDSGTFTMWQADNNDAEGEDLVGVDEKGAIIRSPTCVPTTSLTNTTTPASTAIAAPERTTLSIGAIVGVSVGGVAVLALIGLAIFFWLRKLRNASRGTVAEVPPMYAPREEKPPTPPYGSHPKHLWEINSLQELPNSDVTMRQQWSQPHVDGRPKRQTLPGMHELEGHLDR